MGCYFISTLTVTKKTLSNILKPKIKYYTFFLLNAGAMRELIRIVNLLAMERDKWLLNQISVVKTA